jgi:hypothetical protein
VAEDNLMRAYLAGVMDSDGYFCFKRTPPQFGPDGALISTARYSEAAGLNQVTDAVIQILHSRYGGNIAFYAARTPAARPIYRWRVNDRKAASVAADLLPYLRIKRRDAELLLEMRADKDRPRSETRVPNGMTRTLRHWTGRLVQVRVLGLDPKIAARRERLYLEMRSLHDVKARQAHLFTLRKS